MMRNTFKRARVGDKPSAASDATQSKPASVYQPVPPSASMLASVPKTVDVAHCDSTRKDASQFLTEPQGPAQPKTEGRVSLAQRPSAAVAADIPKASLADLNDELAELIVSFFAAWELARIEAALPDWRPIVSSEDWWRARCRFEFTSTPLPDSPRAGQGASWRETYRILFGAKRADIGAWCYQSRGHGLADRVAQPQLFVGRGGHKLFNYGGWSNRGPQTDLHWVAINTVARATLRHDSDEPGIRPWRFAPVPAVGRHAYRGGVQSLTTLWFGGDAPSADLVAATAREIGASQAFDGDDLILGCSLVMAFGGAQGGYRHEHNDWAVGVLHDGGIDGSPWIVWGQPRPKGGASGTAAPHHEPQARGAHTATYVPGRLMRQDQHPEGCIIVYGGHVMHCTETTSSMDILDIQTWRWSRLPAVGGTSRHGHSTTLVELNGHGYLVALGGGTGNILSAGQEHKDCQVLDLSTGTWSATIRLHCPPHAVPGRHHVACLGLDGQILVFGGQNSSPRPSSKVQVLDGFEAVRLALNPSEAMSEIVLRDVPTVGPTDGQATRREPAPRGRKMHAAACLLPWAPLYVVYGGWETGPHFDDLWVYALGGGRNGVDAYARVGDAEAGAASSGDEGYEEEEDVVGEADFVPFRMMDRNGNVQIMSLPAHVLTQLIRGEVLVPRGGYLMRPQEED